MSKILVTGGSGFIGTNLIEHLSKDTQYEIQNIDIVKPKISVQDKYWVQVDLRNHDAVVAAVEAFAPDYVIHLGARTDLNGKTLQDYEANMGGVSNLLDAIETAGTVKRAIFASSMYVCEPGYKPKDFEDYAPHTLYGESKVETEKRIKTANPSYTWSIIRPTSIWGPWFGEPYNRFFHIVLKRMYFHMGKRACKKTYGYVDNAIYQIISILNADAEKVNRKVFYLGDYEPYDITEWANEIAKHAGIKIPDIPYSCFKLAGWFGDFLKLFGISFPMTSFRLHNMTTDNVHNLNPIKEIAPNLPVGREEGTVKTLEWIS
ncbi:epimerase [Prevotella sp. P5-92]|uniref:NAD-dependent epimerase/dehydratase family protein n=1 Tax=Prevotella sp. P5-92 TaxID=2024222 RepID=UPI000B9769F7|nr:NAD(P)-dependent oxidoreductase [Prevotella sp. P5-92]OYP56133.1 epimerase [Prevotella sp. P5-92]